MATLKATDSASPGPRAFGGCVGLECNLSLPAIGADGWIPAGRIWVSPTDYVLIVHSPRLRDGASYRRRSQRDMRYFVFHEFLNSTHNTDPYDTISAHSGSVFVPLYMGKQWTDARGRRFVIVVQVAPYDVVSLHATDKGSAGPGIEVAKNTSDELQPLQALAGVLIATIAKVASPQLAVVHHRGVEGLPMLNAYKRRLAILREQPGAPTVALPFMPAHPERVARANASLHDLIAPRDGSAAIPRRQSRLPAAARHHRLGDRAHARDLGRRRPRARAHRTLAACDAARAADARRAAPPRRTPGPCSRRRARRGPLIASQVGVTSCPHAPVVPKARVSDAGGTPARPPVFLNLNFRAAAGPASGRTPAYAATRLRRRISGKAC